MFDKKEVEAGLVILILLSFWSFRRYEIIKIKKSNSIQKENNKSYTDINPHFHDLNYFNGKKGSVNDVYSSENNESIKVEDSNVSADRDILRMLLANIRRETFCKYICHEEKKCYFPFAKKLAEEPFSAKMENSDFFFCELNTIKGFASELGNKHKSLPPMISITPGNKEFYTKVILILNSNFSDYRFSVPILAREVDMSISQLNRKMNKSAGYSSGYLIRMFRLYKAASLLISSSASVSEVCFSTGFNDLSYFSRAFKGQFGFSPSSYRRQMTKKS